MYTPLQVREVFHLEFLRWFTRKAGGKIYALKGGTNLRFFFNSFRYSEDMDIDIHGFSVAELKDAVMKILQSPAFSQGLRPFGIHAIVIPDMAKAKQTETTQRFKVHLTTGSGEDLFTKVEFSRRGMKEGITAEPVADAIVRTYTLAPLIVAHYDAPAALLQKINALASRAVIQARDAFDVYVLSSQLDLSQKQRPTGIDENISKKAHAHILEIPFAQFNDTVLAYLVPEDREAYHSERTWDEVKLKAAHVLEELSRK